MSTEDEFWGEEPQPTPQAKPSSTGSGWVPVKFEIDLAGLITSVYGGGDEENPVMANAVELLVQRLTEEVKDELVAEAKQMVLDQVREQVTEAVASALRENVQRTTTYGTPEGEAKPLREVIIEEAKGWSSKASGSNYGYGRNPTMMQRFVAEEVDRAVKEDLRDMIASERKVLQERMREFAAELLAKEAMK